MFLHLVVSVRSHSAFRCVRVRETSTHYFSYSGGTGAVSLKSASGQVTSNLCFCIWCDMPVTYCISVHPGREMSMHYFSCSCGTGMDSTKSAMRYVMLNLCFCIWWDLWVTYCIAVRLGRQASTHYFSCLGGTGTDSTKTRRDTLR
jgi:hypothetical protein